MKWYGRMRNKSNGKVYPLDWAGEIYADAGGLIRVWLNEPNSDPAWTECELELFTGFEDRNGRPIFEGDEVEFNGNRLRVYFNRSLGQWVMDGGSWQGALFSSCHECVIVDENEEDNEPNIY